MQEGLADVGRFGGQQSLEVRHGQIALPRGYQKARVGLPGFDALRIDVDPEPGRFEGPFVVAFEQGEFGGALRNPRIADDPGQFEVLGKRDRGRAALAGNLGDQQVEQQLARKLDRRQCGGLFRRLRAALVSAAEDARHGRLLGNDGPGRGREDGRGRRYVPRARRLCAGAEDQGNGENQNALHACTRVL